MGSVTEVDDGFFVSDVAYENHHDSRIGKLLFDGDPPDKTFHSKWWFLKDKPKKISRMVPIPDINHRYELKDISLESDKFPKVLRKEEATYYDDRYCEWRWKEEFSHLASLYKPVSDHRPDEEKEYDFSWNVIMKLDKIKNPPSFSFSTKKGVEHQAGVITRRDVTHQLIDQIVFPGILLHTRPCKLTSIQTFKIIREYIKQHIDLAYAKITSDYNFCFRVEKVVKLTKPKEYVIDINNGFFKKRKRKPKYETRYRSERSVVIFEMTSEEERYKDYTPIKGFEGKNLADLKKKINQYLKELIEFINEPVKECPSCCGCGVLFPERIDEKSQNKKG